MLPKEINGYDLKISLINDYCHMYYSDAWYILSGSPLADKKESDARAKMIIYLIENGIVKVEDINKRIKND